MFTPTRFAASGQDRPGHPGQDTLEENNLLPRPESNQTPVSLQPLLAGYITAPRRLPTFLSRPGRTPSPYLLRSIRAVASTSRHMQAEHTTAIKDLEGVTLVPCIFKQSILKVPSEAAPPTLRTTLWRPSAPSARA